MPDNRHIRGVLTAFIASPSDLAEERRIAFDVVGEVNGMVKKLGWSIDLLGWEDTLPGFGRPQALINRDVEECDLFIGLLWRRWGTQPALDSTFSSGFEEEFSIAKTRREGGTSPEIWMFFKDVEAAQIADAGEQLKKVITFRDSLVTSKAVLFKNFSSVDEWEKLLRKCLFEHVFSIADIRRGSQEGPTESVASAVQTRVTGTSTQGIIAAGGQIEDLAKFLSPAFETGRVGSITTAITHPNEIAFWAVRATLLSAALVEASGTSTTLLPTHELNTLYRNRSELRATEEELRILFKTILAEHNDTKPGWFWFREEDYKLVINRLIVTAVFEHDMLARSTAFEVLRQATVSLFDYVRDDIVVEALREISVDLREAVWAYLVDIVTLEDIDLLRESIEGAWFESRLDWLQAWLRTSRTIDKFLSGMPDPQLLPAPMKRLITSSISGLSNETVVALWSMPVSELREAAKEEMHKRRISIPEGGVDSKGLLAGPALSSLMSGSSRTNKEEQERLLRLSREDNDALREALTWYDIDGATRYRLLVQRGEIPREVVRRDVSNSFQRIRKASLEQLKEKRGSDAVVLYRETFGKYEELLTSVFTQEALAGLASDPSVEDVALARHCLGDPTTRLNALRIVASVGDPSDVKYLIEIAESSYGEEKKVALLGLERLAVGERDIVKTLMVSETREVRQIGVRRIGDLSEEDAIPLLEDALADQDDDIRVSAVVQVRDRIGPSRLLEVLERYMQRATYFYNVVAWVDRLVYAPAPMSSFYEAELCRRIGASSESALKMADAWS